MTATLLAATDPVWYGCVLSSHGESWAKYNLAEPIPLHNEMVSHVIVPAGSPFRGGDVVVNVKDINQSSLSTPFYSALVSISVSMDFIA